MSAKVTIICVLYKDSVRGIECYNSFVNNLSLPSEFIFSDNSPSTKYCRPIYDLARKVPNCRIISNPHNPGYGEAVNIAAKESSGDFLVFVNPDVKTVPGAIECLVSGLEENPDWGLLGPRLIYPSGDFHESARQFLLLWEFISARTPLNRFFPDSLVQGINKKYLLPYPNSLEPKKVDWLMGSALCCRKKDFQSIGGFDNRYFMYFEDVDLSAKFWKHRKAVVFVPAATMIHHHQRESSKSITWLSFCHLASMLKFYLKWPPSERAFSAWKDA